jgi:hypothetical protein
MSNEPTDTNEIEYGVETELSERELLSIGKIVALWGSLEYEIFCQTLRSFSDSEISGGHVPKAMNNMHFPKCWSCGKRGSSIRPLADEKESYKSSVKAYAIATISEMPLCTECGIGLWLHRRKSLQSASAKRKYEKHISPRTI